MILPLRVLGSPATATAHIHTCLRDTHILLAEALLGADGGGLHPESSDLFLSAISDEFYDVYSDAYYDTGTP
jgi:hypothetical protein